MSLSCKLDLTDSEFAEIVDTTLPLLSQRLNQETQQAALGFFKTLCGLQPDIVWSVAIRVRSDQQPKLPGDSFAPITIPDALKIKDPSLKENISLVLQWV